MRGVGSQVRIGKHASVVDGSPGSRGPPAGPPGCPKIMRAVSKVDGQAGINLSAGSMHYSGHSPGYTWALELAGSAPRNGLHSRSPQVRQLTRNLITASLDTGDATKNDVGAMRFIASLQKVANDCGV